MADRCTPFLGGGGGLGGRIDRSVLLLLLPGSEFILPLQSQFQFGLLTGFCQPQMLFDQLGIPCSFGVEGFVQTIDRLAAGVGHGHQRPERHPTGEETGTGTIPPAVCVE